LILAFAGATPGQATTAQVTNVHMAADSTPASSPVSNYPSGTTDVYFDYTVAATSSETGQVYIYQGDTTGNPVAIGDMDLGTAGDQSLDFTAPSAGATWDDGSYCSVVVIDGVAQSGGSDGPVAWTVGANQAAPNCSISTQASVTPKPTVTDTSTATATPTGTLTVTATDTSTFTPTMTPTFTQVGTATATLVPTDTSTPTASPTVTDTPTPTATFTPTVVTPTATPTAVKKSPKHFVVAIISRLRVNALGTLQVTVTGTHGKPVGAATVDVDASGVGIAEHIQGGQVIVTLVGHTNNLGSVIFRGLKPVHAGWLAIKVSKSGYVQVDVKLLIGT
jgi:hypothetical protein